MSVRPTAVLLHGLGRTHRSLGRIRHHLAAAGYPIWSRTYPSRRHSVEELARWAAERIRAETEGPLVAVTHSLGGLLVRLVGDGLPWQRVVMIAPPNGGSSVARVLAPHHVFRRVFGPAMQDVAGGGPWPPSPAPTGVIAGTRGPSLGNPSSWLVHGLDLLDDDGAHDGTVSVAETRLPGMTDFALVDASHTWITYDRRTLALVSCFLETGRFGADATSSVP